ncbi:DUF4389 domain-containing protein [Streptomyces sp. VRA16 Mangrove soil]|uniref:DUF4389 domain-containing protein n=1 Tax=Streptomyces sp. VRA16 Mangrove soil TaxID=2817434 RepID=UPI001A9F8E10|nr:DUF4389 domain-containing protein [Streptomyces sp. VRA16 Mangrove soil]MBO1333591.1 DUF4389 domain-containing protein [Streptomyces sp. VRA16 Mangrove soil]
MAAPSPHYGAVPLVPGAEPLPELDVPPPGRQHRLTVLLRLLLLLPHAIVLALLSVVTFFVAVAAWCATLVLGRVPDPLEQWLAGYVRYETRFGAASMLLTDRYPPFQLLGEPHGYPVQVRLRSTALNRLAVLLRLFLVIPAALLTALATAGWWAVSVVSWLIVLVLGRMPQPLFEATAAVLRYRMRVSAYVLLLTSAYPKRLFGDQSSAESVIGVVRGPSATRPLMLSGTGRVLVGAFVLLGLVGWAGNAVTYEPAPAQARTEGGAP